MKSITMEYKRVLTVWSEKKSLPAQKQVWETIHQNVSNDYLWVARCMGDVVSLRLFI